MLKNKKTTHDTMPTLTQAEQEHYAEARRVVNRAGGDGRVAAAAQAEAERRVNERQGDHSNPQDPRYYDWRDAVQSMRKSIEANPDFTEGIRDEQIVRVAKGLAARAAYNAPSAQAEREIARNTCPLCGQYDGGGHAKRALIDDERPGNRHAVRIDSCLWCYLEARRLLAERVSNPARREKVAGLVDDVLASDAYTSRLEPPHVD